MPLRWQEHPGKGCRNGSDPLFADLKNLKFGSCLMFSVHYPTSKSSQFHICLTEEDWRWWSPLTDSIMICSISGWKPASIGIYRLKGEQRTEDGGAIGSFECTYILTLQEFLCPVDCCCFGVGSWLTTMMLTQLKWDDPWNQGLGKKHSRTHSHPLEMFNPKTPAFLLWLSFCLSKILQSSISTVGSQEIL